MPESKKINEALFAIINNIIKQKEDFLLARMNYLFDWPDEDEIRSVFSNRLTKVNYLPIHHGGDLVYKEEYFLDMGLDSEKFVIGFTLSTKELTVYYNQH